MVRGPKVNSEHNRIENIANGELNSVTFHLRLPGTLSHWTISNSVTSPSIYHLFMLSLYKAMEAHKVVRHGGFHIFWTVSKQVVVSAVCAGKPFTPRKIHGTHFS
jgi:hypothetical protein